MTPLICAVLTFSSIVIFELLINGGADINGPRSVYGGNLLVRLLQSGKEEAKVKFIIRSGFDLTSIQLQDL